MHVTPGITGYRVEVIADSMSGAGIRLTSVEVNAPRFLLAEINTHGALARSSQSSRATPTPKRVAAVRADPFVPEEFGRNQRGMQAGEALTDQQAAREAWILASQTAAASAERLHELGSHKQHANRVIEPYAWCATILTGTEWANFYNLRTHVDAQPEFRKLAAMMAEAFEASSPVGIAPGDWHAPYTDWDDAVNSALHPDRLPWVSAARCARVSYGTHTGDRSIAKDEALQADLRGRGHMSPFDHPATPFTVTRWKRIRATQAFLREIGGQTPEEIAETERMCRGLEFDGKFRGWVPLRKLIPGEAVFGSVRSG